MAKKQTLTETEEEADTPAPTATAAPANTVRLKHSVAYDGELAVGPESFPVRGGVVNVPARLVAAAHQAGFVPEWAA